MQNVRSYVLCKITHPLRKCVRPYVRPYGPSKLLRPRFLYKMLCTKRFFIEASKYTYLEII